MEYDMSDISDWFTGPYKQNRYIDGGRLWLEIVGSQFKVTVSIFIKLNLARVIKTFYICTSQTEHKVTTN